MTKKDFICSFCNRKQTEVKKLIVGPNVYICDFCTNICAQILHDEDDNHTNDIKNNTNKNILWTPEEIYLKLDEVVASQQVAKKSLSLAAYLHMLKIKHQEEILEKGDNGEDQKLNKNNLLLIGPTGSGKTLLVNTLSKILDVACLIVDANSLTESGYVGEDAEGIIKKLFFNIYSEGKNLQECIKKTEFGILCIDEIDKKYSVDGMANRDVSGKGVQQNLLRIIEGTDVQISLDKKSNEPITINTRNILFITMGAFEGLDKIIWRHMKQNNGFGLIQPTSTPTTTTTPIQITGHQDDYNSLIPYFKRDYLVDFGIIRELLSRLHIIVFFQKLSKDDLISILCNKKNNLIDEYSFILEQHNITLIYDHDVLAIIAEEALKDNMGARGLRSIMHRIFAPILFHIPTLHKNNKDKKYILKITKEHILSNKEPVIEETIHMDNGEELDKITTCNPLVSK